MQNSPVPRAPLPLAGERVAFTGTLASMTHNQAHALVESHGGTATEHVSRQTTLLVVGEEGWPLEPDGKPALKWQQVERWRAEGLEIRVATESEWLEFVGLSESRQEVHRHYTPAMLSQVLNVPVNLIRAWERTQLIKPVARVFRLPYFDFQEVASARRLAELVSAGVSCKEIRSSLERLGQVFGGVERPLSQLEVLARDRRVVVRNARGRLTTAAGQMLFDFEPPAAASESGPVLPIPLDAPLELSAEEWFAEGCRRAERGDLATAIEAFRMALMDEPDRADVQFHLAEALYRAGNVRGAIERYHAAVELDHDYLEGWTQLGCVYAEVGELEAAVEAFDVALDVHSDYPDAHLHLAEALHQLGRTAEAVPHWRRYLDFDQRGPWAAAAKERLELATPRG